MYFIKISPDVYHWQFSLCHNCCHFIVFLRLIWIVYNRSNTNGSVFIFSEERNSLLGGSVSNLSVNVCEIEESESEFDSGKASDKWTSNNGVQHTSVWHRTLASLLKGASEGQMSRQVAWTVFHYCAK